MRNTQADGFIRVSKPRARKEYEAGRKLFICPWKVNPNNVWGIGSMIEKVNGISFDSMINNYSYYNCNYRELGYYPAFYIREGK